MSTQSKNSTTGTGSDVGVKKVSEFNVDITNGNSATSGTVGDLTGWGFKSDQSTGGSGWFSVGGVVGSVFGLPTGGDVDVAGGPGDGLGTGG